MMKFGVKRDVMQERIMVGVDLCIGKLSTLTSQEINPAHILMNTIGNIVNDFVFGVTYEWDDETWQRLLHLQEEGVKLVGVSAGANFLPFLRLTLKYCINRNMSNAFHFSRFLPINRRNMNFLLTGLAQSHKLYDGIADECERTLDTSECCDSILRRFLLEKRDREMRNDELAENCSRKQLNYLLADIFGASLDTTISTLRWYLLMIAANNDAQEKVYREMQTFGLKAQFQLDDIEHLHYLKASVAESQRLNTVVPCGIPHGNSSQSSTLAGYFIPKNTMVSRD